MSNNQIYIMHIYAILFFLGKVTASIGILLVFILASYGYGLSLIKLLRITTQSKLEGYLYSTIIGIGIIGHLVLFLGLVKLLYPTIAYILLAVGIFLLIGNYWKLRFIDRKIVIKFTIPQRINWLHVALIIIIIINVGYSFLANVLTPPLSMDEVAYHMAAAKIYADHHSILYLNTIPHTNWPFEIEMIFTLGLLISSETLAHLVTWVSLIFTCMIFYIYGKKYFKENTGLIAAAIFSSIPVVTTLAGTGLIELPLTMYIVLATLTIIDWFISGDNSSFLLSGLFAGLAASTKFNAVVVPVILGVCIVFHTIFIRKYSLLQILKYFSSYGLLSFIVVLPWYLKTWVQTGNPIWPYLWNILGGKNWDALGSQYFFDFIQSPNMPLTIKNWAVALWRITANPSHYGSYGFDLNWLFVGLVPLSFLALLFYKKQNKPVFIWLGILSIVYYTNWFLQTHQTRFLMPVAGIFSLMIGIGITWLLELRNRRWNIFWSLTLIALLITTSWMAKSSNRIQLINNWPYLSGKITRNQFLEGHVQGYKTFEYINSHLPEDANIWLALYEVRGYYLDRDYLWANPISQRAIPLERFQNADQLAIELKNRGISYVLLQTSTIDAYSYIKYGEVYSSLIRSLITLHGELIFNDTKEQLYKLIP